MAEHLLPDPAAFGPVVRTEGPQATRALAARAAGLLEGGEVLLLHGPLGAGKTCFVQGLCAALDIPIEDVVSPTFTLANRYQGRLVVHHLDFYRIGPADSLDDIGVDAILDEVDAGGAVLVAEWPERLAALAPRRLELLVLPADAPEARDWRLRGVPDLPAAWARLAADAGAGGASC